MQRLRTRSQFQAVLGGSTVARTPHFALHRVALVSAETLPHTEAHGASADTMTQLFDIPEVWMGAMVPKRWARRAVTRNTIKRQIYSVSMAIEAAIPVAAHVVRLRASFQRELFKSATSDVLKRTVRQEIEQLFSKMALSAAEIRT